jgi:hypothetical protein
VKKLPLILLSAALLVLPALSEACTVCFGKADGNLQRGFFWGIVVLGALPFTMLAFFITYLIRATRKKQTP